MPKRTMLEVRDLTGRLPIGGESYGIYEALLWLPYDIFRPIMDMLFDGTITQEDLVDTIGAAQLSVEADADRVAAERAAASCPDASASAVVSSARRLVYGRRSPVAIVERDGSSAGVNSLGEPGASPVTVMATASQYLLDTHPNPIQVRRADGDVIEAARRFRDSLITVRPRNEDL